MLGCTALLFFERQFVESDAATARATGFGVAMIGLAAALALANGVSTVLECGAGLCPDNPVVYELLQGLKGP